MKKTWIIIGSILTIALLGAAWWYLLMYGRPKSLSDVPNPFATTTDVPRDTPAPATTTPMGTGPLRKIATTPSAGAVMLSREGTTFVRYMERGTGHIFEVDTNSGATERITGTTIPRTTSAVWSPQGSRVILTTEDGTGGVRIFAGTIERADEGAGILTTSEIEGSAKSIAFASSSESVYYTTTTSGTGSTGYTHNLQTGKRVVRFTAPLRDMVVRWEPLLTIYTTPSARVRGYAYRGTPLLRLTGGVGGLMILPTNGGQVISYAQNKSLISRINTLDGTVIGIPVFPEKCAAEKTGGGHLWCGAPLALAPAMYPDSWYDGSISFDDSIWKVDLQTGSAAVMSNPSVDVHEAIDATDMQVNDAGTMLLFINKKDGSLWIQEIR